MKMTSLLTPVAVCTLLAFSATSHAATINTSINSTQEATVDSSSTAVGNTMPLKLFLESGGGSRESAILLQFDLSSIKNDPLFDSFVGTAEITLNYIATNNSIRQDRDVNVFGVLDSAGLEGWNEATVSGTNAPGIREGGTGNWHLALQSGDVTSVLASRTLQTGGYALMDPDLGPVSWTNTNITSFLNDDTDDLVTFIFKIDNNSGNGIFWDFDNPDFNSPAIAPSLSLSYSQIPEPATTAAMLGGVVALIGLMLKRRANRKA